MKKLLCLLLALVMVLSLAACGEDEDKRRDDDEDEDDERTSQHDSEEEEEEQDEEEEEETEDESDEDSGKTDSGTDSSNEPYMDSLKARFGASTPDGYGIWTFSSGMTTTGRGCVDTRGYITFEMPKSESALTGVYNAVVVTKDGDNTYLRSAKDGTVLFDASEYGDAAIIVPEHRGNMMFQDGYVLVVSKSESYDGVTYEVGFLDAKGKWICQLSGDHPILANCAEEADMDFFEEDLKYCGEGILAFECDDDACRYYNIKTGKLVELSLPSGLEMDDVCEEVDCGILFRDGCTGPVYIYNEGFYNFYTDGTVEAFDMTFYSDFKRGDVQGDYYYDTDSGLAYYLVENSKGVYLCDSQGNLVRHIENVDLADCNGFTAEGTVQMIFENSEETCYYVVMDVEGEFLFDPVKLDDSINGVYDPAGNEVEPDSHYGTGCFLVVSNSGEILLQTGYVDDFEIRNGVAYYDDGSDVYVDVSK